MSQSNRENLYFIALLPPDDIAVIANHWQQYCVDHFATKIRRPVPPHITLQPPFKWPVGDRQTLDQFLQSCVEKIEGIPITLDGFDCFAPRVIFIDVKQTPELLAFQQRIKTEFSNRFNIRDKRYGDRPFHPHITIAYKELDQTDFEPAWEFFKEKPLNHEFVVPELTLLKYSDQGWNIDQTFSFK